MNVGATCPAPVDGLVTTLAWDLGTDGDVAIGADGGPRPVRSRWPTPWRDRSSCPGPASSGCATGSASSASRRSSSRWPARSTPPRGSSLVPAFTGLGSPHWDPGARGTITGLSRGTGRAHLARAMVEAMGFQVRDVLDAMGGDRHRPDRGPGRRRGRRHGPAAPAPGRPDPARGGPPPVGRDHRASVRPPWPAWPRGCGARSTT